MLHPGVLAMRSHTGLLPQCLFIMRSGAKVKRLEESYVSRAAQRPLWRRKRAQRQGSYRLQLAKWPHAKQHAVQPERQQQPQRAPGADGDHGAGHGAILVAGAGRAVAPHGGIQIH